MWRWIPGGYYGDEVEGKQGVLKGHAVPDHMYVALRRELKKRCNRKLPGRTKPIASMHIDAGGMMHLDRPIEAFQIRGGLRLEIPSEDLGFMLEQLKGLEPRRFARSNQRVFTGNETIDGLRAESELPSLPGGLGDVRIDLEMSMGQRGWPYYKLHADHRCLVLTPAHYRRLLADMTERMPEADRRAKTFWAQHTPPAQVLREVAAAVTGTPIEQIGDLGGHRVDEHLPKTTGQA